VLAVGRNYRSTPEIVATAARLIGHNRARRPKPLAAVRAGGPLPQILAWGDDRAEAEGLAACCAEWLRTSAPPIAILARVTACLTPIARACEARGLTVRVLAERPLARPAARSHKPRAGGSSPPTATIFPGANSPRPELVGAPPRLAAAGVRPTRG
jgi:superfamily I DNA/RNA helicase